MRREIRRDEERDEERGEERDKVHLGSKGDPKVSP